MEVEDPFTAFADALLNIWFLNVHVESVQQQPKIVLTHQLDQFQPFSYSVYQSAFLAVDWFKRQPHSCRAGRPAAFLQGNIQPHH